jgi:hypothetical protein
MRKAIIVATSVVVCLAALGTGAYLWWHSTFDLPRASCGQYSPMRSYPNGNRALPCFAKAAQACKPAGINLWEQGVESATDYVFTIGPGGRPGACPVTVASQAEGLWGGPVQHARCERMTVTSDAVLLDCPSLSPAFAIPLTTPRIRPNPLMGQYNSARFCGNVFARAFGAHTRIVTQAGFSPSADRATLRCFAAAARTCAHVSIVVVSLDSPVQPSFGFAIEQGAKPPTCQVARSLPNRSSGPGPVVTYDRCVVTSVSTRGVLLACADRSFLIPAAVA